MGKLTSAIGLLAAMYSTLSFLPQALKIIKTKDTKSISLSMSFVYFGCFSLANLWYPKAGLTRNNSGGHYFNFGEPNPLF